MLNKRYIKSIKRDIVCFDFLSSILVSIFFCYILERKDKKWFKHDIIVLISFLILSVSISFLVNIGKEMSIPGFRTQLLSIHSLLSKCTILMMLLKSASKSFAKDCSGFIFCSNFNLLTDLK